MGHTDRRASGGSDPRPPKDALHLCNVLRTEKQMSDSSGRAERAPTPPFAALLARALAVCTAGGAFFGAVFFLAVGAASNADVGAESDLARVLADGSLILVLATAWALLLVLPISLPAGAIAASMIWWLRGKSWQPQSRALWVLLGSVAGIAVAACLVMLLSAAFLLSERESPLTVAMVSGAACGAVLAWFEPRKPTSERR